MLPCLSCDRGSQHHASSCAVSLGLLVGSRNPRLEFLQSHPVRRFPRPTIAYACRPVVASAICVNQRFSQKTAKRSLRPFRARPRLSSIPNDREWPKSTRPPSSSTQVRWLHLLVDHLSQLRTNFVDRHAFAFHHLLLVLFVLECLGNHIDVFGVDPN